MEHFILEKQVLCRKDCKRIINFFESHEKFQHVAFNALGVVDLNLKDCTQMSPNFRDSKYDFVNNIIFKALENIKHDYIEKYSFLDNNRIKWMKWDITAGYNIQKYNPGQAYHALHIENAGDEGTERRVLVWMIYLNTVNDGGGTYFDHYDKIIKAEEGKGVLWPAYWTHPHKGIESETETKYIATGWYEFMPG